MRLSSSRVYVPRSSLRCCLFMLLFLACWWTRTASAQDCPPNVGCIRYEWDIETHSCLVFPNPYVACDDGNPCTYDDFCDGSGTCVGTPITCTGTVCQPQSCNGTSSCTISNAPAGTACNTGNICTYNDQCNGSGSCFGTPVTVTTPSGTVEPCSSTTCQSRQCNKTPTCTILSNAAAGVACNDGNACTYNDECDGTGGCGGTAITCSSTACSTQTCNGTSSCAVTLKPSATQCHAATTGYNASNCDGTSPYCPVSCAAGYKVCGSTCIPSGSCCTNADCPVAGGFQTCASGVCSAPIICAAGYKACLSSCIAETACCSSADCAPVQNATATCSANGCSYSCIAGYQQCGNSCISSTACCG